MMDVRINHREFMTDSNRTSDSRMRFLLRGTDKSVWETGWNDIREGGKSAHLCLPLEEILVIFTEGSAENDRSYGFETMYPFFTLRALATDVKHVYSVVGNCPRFG